MDRQVRLRVIGWVDNDPSGVQTVSFRCEVVSEQYSPDTSLLTSKVLGGKFDLYPHDPVVSSIEMNKNLRQVFTSMGQEVARVESPLAVGREDALLRDFAHSAGEEQVLNAFSSGPFLLAPQRGDSPE